MCNYLNVNFQGQRVNVYGSETEVGSSPKRKEERALVVGRNHQQMKCRPSRNLLKLQFMDTVLMYSN